MMASPAPRVQPPRRLPDWEARLLRFVRSTRGQPFRWAHQDGLAWALRAVDAMCGSAVAAAHRGCYASPELLCAHLVARGWTTLLDAAVAAVGTCPSADPRLATAGNLVWFPVTLTNLVPSPGGVLGVLVATRAQLPGQTGLQAVPVLPALRSGARIIPVA